MKTQTGSLREQLEATLRENEKLRHENDELRNYVTKLSAVKDMAEKFQPLRSFEIIQRGKVAGKVMAATPREAVKEAVKVGHRGGFYAREATTSPVAGSVA